MICAGSGLGKAKANLFRALPSKNMYDVSVGVQELPPHICPTNNSVDSLDFKYRTMVTRGHRCQIVNIARVWWSCYAGRCSINIKFEPHFAINICINAKIPMDTYQQLSFYSNIIYLDSKLHGLGVHSYIAKCVFQSIIICFGYRLFFTYFSCSNTRSTLFMWTLLCQIINKSSMVNWFDVFLEVHSLEEMSWFCF